MVLVLFFLAGAIGGSFVNLAACRLAWRPTSISPWSRPEPPFARRTWIDRLPILGWLALRRESSLRGTCHWLRPMFVEISCGALAAGLYWWEFERAGLVAGQIAYWLAPALAHQVDIDHRLLAAPLTGHLVLCGCMLVASLIDIDERLIPDTITVPGTLLGLVLATLLPQSLLPLIDPVPAGSPFAVALTWPGGAAVEPFPDEVLSHRFLTLAGPEEWPVELKGTPRVPSLLLGLSCIWLWCFAIAPRPWYTRHGWQRAWKICCARFFRGITSLPLSVVIVASTLWVTGAWYAGGRAWAGLLSSLVGLAAGGGLVWSVRLIGRWALRKEAMGFGDVTLMMMIGAFLGWQACLITFFISPFAGLVVGLIQWIAVREQAIPFGPFLCLAALVTITAWAGLWNWLRAVFAIGWLIPAVLLASLAAMWAMLTLWRLAVSAVAGSRR